MKKLFFYPTGVGKALGTTEIQTTLGASHFVEGVDGTWVLFENSVARHRPSSPTDRVPRPTIEIDLLPALSTNVELPEVGLNGWYPWFPLWEAGDLEPALPAHARLPVTETRLLKRILGLAIAVPNRDLSLSLDPHFDPR